MPFNDITREPDAITIFGESQAYPLSRGAQAWANGDFAVRLDQTSDATGLTLSAPALPVTTVVLRWQGEIARGARILGDAWERGYGDLEWRGVVSERPMPWYFLVYEPGDKTSGATHGYGVKTGCASMVSWNLDEAGITLRLDVRSGGVGVMLGARELQMADIVARNGNASQSPFIAAQALCRALCDAPRLPDHIVYGSNNWYYAYGQSSHAEIINDAEILAEATGELTNRPYMVIDAGWQVHTDQPGNASCDGGDWSRGISKFPDMPGLAAAMAAKGTRPGIWIRPLFAPPGTETSLTLPLARTSNRGAMHPILDPSIPENLAKAEDDCARMNQWGYRLIKHDFTTYDITGRWGFDMGTELTNPGWQFADKTRTTAEVVLDLYKAIRRGSGSSIVIGCNTFSHLSAGLFELQRTGDDTSGMEWERTRKMGVNTLAFRMAQHGAFYAVDADCVGLTKAVPWDLNRQWLDVLARSGTPLFVSAAPEAVGPEQKQALMDAFATASVQQPLAEPLDWLDTTCPREWAIGGETVTYAWSEGIGAGFAQFLRGG